MNKRFLVVLAAMAMWLCCHPAAAHDYWIMPSEFQLQAPGWISFDFTAGHRPFFPDENPLQEGFQLQVFQPNGVTVELPALLSGNRRTAGEIKLDQIGTYLLTAYSAQPAYWTQTEDGKSHNLPKNEVQGPIKKSGMYVKSIKTFVDVRDMTNEVLGPCGYAIELVPVQHPGNINVGQSLQVKALYKGQPLANTEVFAFSDRSEAKGGHDRTAAGKTDDQGIATVNFGGPGVWVIYCKHEVPTPGDAKAEFSNYRGYIMLEVKAEQAKK
jgi:uncharacterized GH25 family protein